MKWILTRIAIYSFATLPIAFITKAKIDFYISHSNPEDAIRLFIEKIPNGSIFFYAWGGTFLVGFVPATIYEIYLRKKNIEK